MLSELLADNAIKVQLIGLAVFDVFFAIYTAKNLLDLLRKSKAKHQQQSIPQESRIEVVELSTTVHTLLNELPVEQTQSPVVENESKSRQAIIAPQEVEVPRRSLEVSPKVAAIVLLVAVPLLGYWVYVSRTEAPVESKPTFNGQEVTQINGVSLTNKEAAQSEAVKAITTNGKLEITVRDKDGKMQKTEQHIQLMRGALPPFEEAPK